MLQTETRDLSSGDSSWLENRGSGEKRSVIWENKKFNNKISHKDDSCGVNVKERRSGLLKIEATYKEEEREKCRIFEHKLYRQLVCKYC